MIDRLGCWRRGHDWGQRSQQVYEDMFGNEWRLRSCLHCSATRRVLHRAWSDI